MVASLSWRSFEYLLPGDVSSGDWMRRSLDESRRIDTYTYTSTYTYLGDIWRLFGVALGYVLETRSGIVGVNFGIGNLEGMFGGNLEVIIHTSRYVSSHLIDQSFVLFELT